MCIQRSAMQQEDLIKLGRETKKNVALIEVVEKRNINDKNVSTRYHKVNTIILKQLQKNYFCTSYQAMAKKQLTTSD